VARPKKPVRPTFETAYEECFYDVDGWFTNHGERNTNQIYRALGDYEDWELTEEFQNTDRFPYHQDDVLAAFQQIRRLYLED
jgi:hypothetical protein